MSDTLRQLDSAWARSYATNDTVLAGKLFDDSLIVTSGNGRLKGKKGELADVGPTPGGQIHYFRTRDVVAPVTVKQQGGLSVFEGAFPLRRLDYAIGEGAWSDTETVADEVQIKFRITGAAGR